MEGESTTKYRIVSKDGANHYCLKCRKTFGSRPRFEQHMKIHYENLVDDFNVEGPSSTEEEEETHPSATPEHARQSGEEKVKVEVEDDLPMANDENQPKNGQYDSSTLAHSLENHAEKITDSPTSKHKYIITNNIALQQCPVSQVSCMSKEGIEARLETPSQIESNCKANKRTYSVSESEIVDVQDNCKSNPATADSDVEVSGSKVILKCKVCGSVFMENATLEVHVKTHQDCAHFGDQKSLPEHMEKHEVISGTITKAIDKDVHECSLCKVVFATRKLLTEHNVRLKHYSCNQCGLILCDEETLGGHLQDHIHKCTLCKQGFIEAILLAIHMKTHPKCDMCGCHFLKENALEEHLKVHPKCAICQSSCFDETALEMHMKKHSQCAICYSYFLNKTLLKKHMNISHCHRCSICKLRFGTRNLLNEHNVKLIHYSCTRCGLILNDKETLDEHLKVHIHECTLCKQDYGNPISFDAHMKTHPKCDECGSYFINENELEEHLKVHPKCVTCQSSCFDETALEMHMKKHSQCPICSSYFLNRTLLNNHIKVSHCHRCLLCKSFFVARNLLIEHNVRHRHYRCTQCGLILNDEETLDEHVKDHQKCPLCKQDFADPILLDEHIKTHPACDVCGCHFFCRKCIGRAFESSSQMCHMSIFLS